MCKSKYFIILIFKFWDNKIMYILGIIYRDIKNDKRILIKNGLF